MTTVKGRRPHCEHRFSAPSSTKDVVNQGWSIIIIINHFYIALFSDSRADSLRSHVILHEWILFIARFWISTEVVYLQRWHGWCHKNLLPESQSRHVLCTPYNHAPCHFMQSHIGKVYACLAVTCHLRFWQDDRGLLRATAVTRGWNGYRNKSQHRKLTLEKKILPPLQQGFEPASFRSRVRRSNHWAIPAHGRRLVSIYVMYCLKRHCACCSDSDSLHCLADVQWFTPSEVKAERGAWTTPEEYSWGEVTKVTEIESEAWSFQLRPRCRGWNLHTLSTFCCITSVHPHSSFALTH